jgi:hypothetical protein
VEEQESDFRKMVYYGWFVLVGLLVAGAVLLNRIQNATPKATASPS